VLLALIIGEYFSNDSFLDSGVHLLDFWHNCQKFFGPQVVFLSWFGDMIRLKMGARFGGSTNGMGGMMREVR
jgi:hypothetical protein